MLKSEYRTTTITGASGNLEVARETNLDKGFITHSQIYNSLPWFSHFAKQRPRPTYCADPAGGQFSVGQINP